MNSRTTGVAGCRPWPGRRRRGRRRRRPQGGWKPSATPKANPASPSAKRRSRTRPATIARLRRQDGTSASRASTAAAPRSLLPHWPRPQTPWTGRRPQPVRAPDRAATRRHDGGIARRQRQRVGVIAGVPSGRARRSWRLDRAGREDQRAWPPAVATRQDTDLLRPVRKDHARRSRAG